MHTSRSVTVKIREETGVGTHHLKEEMTKSLILGRLTRVGLDSNEESTLEVCERVEVEEEVVDLVLRDDIVCLDLALIILRSPSISIDSLE